MLGLGPVGGTIAALGAAVVLSVFPPQGPKAGGTDVAVRGLNFTSGSTITFGVTAQTTTFVDNTKYTLTTAAGDSNYVDDVTVAPAVGQSMTIYSLFDRVSSIPGTLNPALQTLSGYWPNTYTGTPTVGVASAGSSSGNNQNAGTTGWTAPATGATVNGFVAARFNGTTDGRQAISNATVMLGTTGWSYTCLLNVASLVAGLAGSGYADAPLFTDSTSVVGVTVSNLGVRAYQADAGAGYHYTPDLELPTSTWVLVQARWTGTILQCRVNCGPWSTVVCPSLIAVVGPDMWFSKSGYNPLAADKLFEIMQNSTWSYATCDGLAAYVQNRYALNLGFPIGGVASLDPATLDETGYFIDYAGTIPWTGTASAGNSASHNLGLGIFVTPGAGSLNGHGTATLNGTTQAFQASHATNVLLGTEDAIPSFTMTYLVKYNSYQAVSGGIPYANPELFTDPQAVLGIGAAADSGVQFVQIDENDGNANYTWTPDGTLVEPTATWMMINARWNGRDKIDIRALDGAINAWSSQLCRRPAYPTAGGQPYIGTNYSGGLFSDVEIAAITYSKRNFSTNALDGVGVFFQTRYALSLGLPTSVAYSRTQTENVAKPTDVNTRVGVFFRTMGETIVKPTDVNTRAQVLARLKAENIPIPTDVNARALVASRTQLESILKPTDVNTRALVQARTQPENIAIPTDVNARSQVLARTQLENVPIPTDANTRVRGAVRVQAENIGIPTDVNTRSTAVARTQNENVPIPTDANTRALTVSRTQAENVVAPTDVNTRATAVLRTQLENVVKPTDANTRQVVFFRTIGESIAIPTDVNTRAIGYSRTVAENVNAPTDANTRVGVFFRTNGENVAIPTDVNSRVVSGHTDFFKTMNENIGAPTDANTRALVLSRAMLEAIAIPTDVNTRSVGFFRAQAESILKPTDANTRALALTRTQAENVPAPTDVNTRIAAFLRTQLESILKPTDANLRTVGYVRLMPENVPAPTDANTRALVLSRTKLENIAIPTDVNTRATALSRSMAEVLSAPTDVNARAIGVSRTMLENVLKPTDANTRAYGIARFVAENLPKPTDANTRQVVFFRLQLENIPIPVDVFETTPHPFFVPIIEDALAVIILSQATVHFADVHSEATITQTHATVDIDGETGFASVVITKGS